MSFLKDYEKAKASGSSGSSGGKTIAQKRADAELQKKYPEYSGVKNVLKNYTQDVDAGFIDSYINDINSYTMDVDWDNIGWGSAQQAYRNYADRIKNLRSRGGKILGYLDRNVTSLDPDSYHILKDQIIASQNSLAEQMGALNEVNQYYSQWDTEDAYNTAMQKKGWMEKYQGKPYLELTPILETLEDGDEKNWLTEYAGVVDYDERVNMDLDSANQEIQTLQDQLTRFKNIEEMYNEYRGSPLLMLTQGDTFRDLESRYDSFNEKYGSIDKLQETIQKKRLRMAEAKQTQDSIQAEADLEEWKKTVRDSGTIQKDLDRLNATLAMTQENIRNLNRGSTQQDLTLRGEADAQRQVLEQQKAELEQELQYSRMQEYAALMHRPDFAEKSRYVPTGNGNAIRDNATGMYVDTGFKDIEYDYINKNEKAQTYQGTMDSLSNLQRMGLDRSWLLQMTEDEVAVYNYLYHTAGKDAAGEYLDVMRGPLNQRQREAESLEWAEKAKKNPVLTSGFSVALAPLKTIGLMGQAADYLADGSIDQNAGYNRASYVTAAIRNEASKIAQEKWGPVGSFAYQTAMSLTDFAIQGLAGGGFLGVPGVTLAIMASGTAADEVMSNKDKGLSDDQSFGLGIIAGLAEALTERFSLEALLDADLLKNGIGVYMLKNSLTEGSEEAASSIINLFADIAASKEKSEWQDAIRMYQDQGYSQEEAFSKAVADQAATLGMDFLGGVVSGGVMAGGTSAGYYADTKRTGRAMGRRGLTDTKQVQEILDTGANAEKGSTANLVAGQLQKKVDAGKELSQYDKGRLYQSNPQAVGETVFGQGDVQLANPVVRGIDSKHEDWKQAQRLASITGREIRFYNGDPNEDGQYDPRSGQIFINVDRASENQVAYVFAHELTHSTELGESYKDLHAYIKGKLIAEGRDWNLMIRRKKEAYAKQGHPLESDAEAEAELVAVEVQNRLLSNEQELYELFWEEPTIGQKILNWLDKILARFKNGDDARERVFANEARQRVLRAWESANQARKQGVQPQREQTNQSNQAFHESEQEDRSEMSDEEMDEWLEYQEHEAAVREGEEELGRQYSISSSYSDEITQWDQEGRYPGASFTLGTTGDVLQGLGAIESDIYMYGDKINQIMSDHPEMTMEEIKKIPQILEDPILILKSRNVGRGRSANTRMVMYGSVQAQNGAPVLTVLDLRPVENNLVIDDMQKVSSAYTKETNPTGYVSNSEVVYADKKRTAKLLRTIGFQMPIELQQSGYIGSITYDGQRVNISGTKFRDLVAENGAMPFKTGARKSGLPSGDAPSEISVRDHGPEVKDNDMTLPEENQFSLAGATTLNKRDVARDLRAILSRGGDPRELQRYVDGLEQTGRKAEQKDINRYQTGVNRNSTAQEILETAHSQGQGVEEYLRWNPEQFERDGRWRPEALEALRMEQGGRKYSLNEEADATQSDATAPDESTESQAGGIQRENLPSKALSVLRRTENKLRNTIGKAMSIPQYARYSVLQETVEEITSEYLATGTISDDKIVELFDKAYAAGVVYDTAFYDKYKAVKETLLVTAITVDTETRNALANYQDFCNEASGVLRMLNNGGKSIGEVYEKMRDMAPELFSEEIRDPVDQLNKMLDVGKSIKISERTLEEHYGEERETFRKWKMNDFRAAIGYAMKDMNDIKRLAEDGAYKEDVPQVYTPEEAEKVFEEQKKARRKVEKERAKNPLTVSDEELLGRLLKGEIGLQHLNPNTDNVKGIEAVYKAKLEYEAISETVRAYKRNIRAKRLKEADDLLETANTWKDKRSGIMYARETMRRNIIDIVPDRKLAEKIIETYFETVHMAEAKSTKFKNDYRDRVRALNLSTKVIKGNLVSEAHAVQLLGEAMDNIRVMENARGRMGMRDGKTLAEWRAVVDDLWMNNTGLDRQKVERAVEEFRKIYDELFQQMNRIRVENGYEPVNYRQGYFPHFQPGGDGIMGFFGKVMGINTQVDALPTTINGLTHTFKPGIQWFGNAQERIGFNTAYDAVEGFDRYIEGVASVIFQTENIQKLRALATQARYRTSDEGIRKQVDAVRMDDRLTEEEKQREINAIYEHGRFALSNFVAELDEYTNLLANKKSKYDRTMESLIGRRAYTMMKAWENRVGANMIAGNLSSALTNFIPLTQAGAQLDTGMILKGMIDTLRNMKNGDGLAEMSDFLTNRRGSDVLVKTWMQKASGVMGTPMELIDNFTSESIVRAAYLQNLKRGMSETEAMHQADIFAAGVMADRSKGAMPTMFESRNPLFKAFTQFQLEVNNQFSEVFKDLPRNHREKGLAMLAMILLKYFLGAWMYNELFEKVIGRRAALDPIGILLEAGEDLTGYEIPNLFDMIGGEKIEKTGEGSIGEAGANLATNILGELPFAAGLTLFGVETDGGRLPAASAIPDFSAVWEAATGWDSETGEDLKANQRWKLLQDELNKGAYVLPPFGGGQISKSWKGIKAYLEGGSYSLDKDGDEILQYPVYKDDPDDAFWSLVRAAFLGKNSLPEAQEWVKNGYNSLNQYETVVYQDLLNCGVKDRDAFDLVNQLRALEETETESGARRAQGRRILAKSGISAEGKAVAFYGMVAAKTEQEWMDQLVEAGAEQADTMAFVSNLYDADKLKGTEKKQEQLVVFLDAPLTEEEKKVAVGFIMDTDLETESGNPTQYAKFLSALETGLTVDKYMEIRATETDIEDYLELTDIGIKGDKSADLAISMATLEPMEGYDKVSWIQRCRAVMDADLNETQKIQALQTVDGLYESTYEKIVTGHNFGMNVNSYIDLKSIMPHFDENGNGSYTQGETEAAINALAGDDNALYALTGTTPNGYTLTDREKAILWQLQNKTWKPYRNPFDREVGQMVYDYMTADDSAEAVTKAESGEVFDIANLFSKVR